MHIGVALHQPDKEMDAIKAGHGDSQNLGKRAPGPRDDRARTPLRARPPASLCESLGSLMELQSENRQLPQTHYRCTKAANDLI
jgi:hypothetical protein